MCYTVHNNKVQINFSPEHNICEVNVQESHLTGTKTRQHINNQQLRLEFAQDVSVTENEVVLQQSYTTENYILYQKSSTFFTLGIKNLH